MASYVLTAQLQLQQPANLGQVVKNIQTALGGVKVAVKPVGISQTATEVRALRKATDEANSSADKLAKTFALSFKRFVSYSIATRAVGLFSTGLANAVRDAIDFEAQVIRISQVTGKSAAQLKDLTSEITRLSTSLGVGSEKLAEVSVILAQAGFTANDTKIALEALAKTELTPTFTDIIKTTEGAVALFNQFGKGAKALAQQLGAINTVSAAFAVESDDLIDAVRRVGGVFRSSGGTLEELISLFTSIRATTRESAESISTAMRTIFVRIQRPKTIAYLEEFGVKLTDLEGRFVGPFEAVKRLSEVFGELEQGDPKFIQVAEELGGFRQIGKVIPLLQQFKVSQDALNVAKQGTESLDRDAIKAQESLANRITKVREEFLALVRDIYSSPVFQVLANSSLLFASALIKVADAIKNLIPLIGVFAALKISKSIGGFLGSFGKNLKEAQGFASGGTVPGTGNGDTVPAMLTPGEFVLRKSVARKIGYAKLNDINGRSSGKTKEKVQYFANGGVVRRVGVIDKDVLDRDKDVSNQEIARLGITGGTTGLKRYLIEEATRRKKAGQLNKLKSITGVAGSGKSTLAEGGRDPLAADNATLRKTTRKFIFSVADLDTVDEVVEIGTTMNPEREEFIRNSNFALGISSTTKEEKDLVRARKEARTEAGTGYGRAPGSTKYATADSIGLEAEIIGAGLSNVKFRSVLGGTKTADELPEVIKKKIGLFYGSFSPTTVGHRAVMDVAGEMGIRPEDFLVLVADDVGGKRDDEHSHRNIVFNQKFRAELARRSFNGANISAAKSDETGFGGSLPGAFDISVDGKKRFIVPDKGSIAFASDEKGEASLKKYRDNGYDVKITPRIGDISGTKARNALFNNDIEAMGLLLTSAGQKLVEHNAAIIKARKDILDRIFTIAERQTAEGLAGPQAALESLPTRFDKPFLNKLKVDILSKNPDLSAKDIETQAQETFDRLKAEKDPLSKQVARVKRKELNIPLRIMGRLERLFPEKYGFKYDVPDTQDNTSINSSSALQKEIQAAANAPLSSAPEKKVRVAKVPVPTLTTSTAPLVNVTRSPSDFLKEASEIRATKVKGKSKKLEDLANAFALASNFSDGGAFQTYLDIINGEGGKASDLLRDRYFSDFKKRAIKRASGGFVPGSGNGDTVPAMLTPGEYVLKKSAAQKLGKEKLDQLNSGKVQHFANGGYVQALNPEDFAAFTLTGQSTNKHGLPPNGVKLSKNSARTLLVKQRLITDDRNKNEKGIEKSNSRKINIEDTSLIGPFSIFSMEDSDVPNRIVEPSFRKASEVALSAGLESIKESDLSKILKVDPLESFTENRKFSIDQLFDSAKDNLKAFLLEGTLGLFSGAKLSGGEDTDSSDANFDFRNLDSDDRKGLSKLYPFAAPYIKSLKEADAKLSVKAALDGDSKLVNKIAKSDNLQAEFYDSFLHGSKSTALDSIRGQESLFGTLSNDNDESIAKKLASKNLGTREIKTAISRLKSKDTSFSPLLSKVFKAYKIDDKNYEEALDKLRNIVGFASGGFVPGSGSGDTVPAMLTPGEFVINKRAAQRIGKAELEKLNGKSSSKSKGGTQYFAKGGSVLGGLGLENVNIAALATGFALVSGTLSSLVDEGTTLGKVISTLTNAAIAAGSIYFLMTQTQKIGVDKLKEYNEALDKRKKRENKAASFIPKRKAEVEAIKSEISNSSTKTSRSRLAIEDAKFNVAATKESIRKSEEADIFNPGGPSAVTKKLEQDLLNYQQVIQSETNAIKDQEAAREKLTASLKIAETKLGILSKIAPQEKGEEDISRGRAFSNKGVNNLVDKTKASFDKAVAADNLAIKEADTKNTELKTLKADKEVLVASRSIRLSERKDEVSGLKSQNFSSERAIEANSRKAKASNDPQEKQFLLGVNEKIKEEIAARKVKIKDLYDKNRKEVAAINELNLAIKNKSEEYRAASDNAVGTGLELGTRQRDLNTAKTLQKNANSGFGGFSRNVADFGRDKIGSFVTKSSASIKDFASKAAASATKLATGFAVATQLIQSAASAAQEFFTGKAEKALEKGDYDSFRANSELAATSGKVSNIAGTATQGAIAGAAIGSFIPVIGTAVGAVVGGVLGTVVGAFSAFQTDFAAQKEIETKIFDETLKRSAQSVSDFTTGLINATDFAEQYGKSQQENRKALNGIIAAEIGTKQQKETGIGRKTLNSIGAAGSGFANFGRSVGNYAVTGNFTASGFTKEEEEKERRRQEAASNKQNFANLDLTTQQNLRRQYQQSDAATLSSIDSITSSGLSKDNQLSALDTILKDLGEAASSPVAGMEDLAARTLKAAEGMRAFAEMAIKEESYNAARISGSSIFNRILSESSDSLAKFTTGLNEGESNRSAIDFALNNIGGSKEASSAIDSVLNSSKSILGSASKEFIELEREGNNLRSSLNAYDSLATSGFKIGTGDAGDKETVETQVTEAFGGNEYAKKLAQSFISTLPSSFTNEDLQIAFEKFNKDSKTKIEEYNKLFFDGLEFQAETERRKVAALKQVNTAFLEQLNAVKAAVEINKEAAQVIASAGGKQFTPQDSFRLDVTKLNAEAAAIGDRFDTNTGKKVEGGLDFSVRTGGTDELIASGEKARARFQQLQEQITSGNNNTVDFTNLQAEADQLKGFIGTLIDTQRSQIESINKSIEIQERKNQLEKDSYKDLASGDIGAFFKKRAAVAAQNAAVSGNTGVLNSLGAQAASDALTNLENLKSTGVTEVGGRSIEGAGGLKEALSNSVLKQRGVTNEEGAKIFAGTDRESEKLRLQKLKAGQGLGALGDISGGLGNDTFLTATKIFEKSVLDFSRRVYNPATEQQAASNQSANNNANAAAVANNITQTSTASNRGVGGASPQSASNNAGLQFFTQADQTNFQTFLTATQKLTDAVEKLSQSEIRITLAPTNVNVNVSAPDIVKAMGPAVQTLVYNSITTEIEKLKVDLRNGKV